MTKVALVIGASSDIGEAIAVRAGTSSSHDPDDRDDRVSHKDEPIAHAPNDDRG
jgi:NAD(P)-dependent dehydrogenase (short-subunit alcohol dehydrogenase family)